MRHSVPTVLAVLVAAAGIAYGLMLVSRDLRRVSDDLDVVARDMSTISDDVRSIADDVNAIADALAGEPEDDEQRQTTGVSYRQHVLRLRRTHLVIRQRARARVIAGAR
jgi:hypothetical protein